MTRTDEASRERLAAAMDQRRIELRLQWEEVASRAGISTAHLRKFRRGGAELGALARAQLEEALQWAPSSLLLVEAGQDPILLPSATSARPAEAEAEESAPRPSPHPPRERRPTVEELRAEIDAHLARMSPEERAKWEQHMEDADRQLELVMMRRRLSFIRLMRGEPAEPD